CQQNSDWPQYRF
nr:immunoglobulin light chain junction region [Macaca mulatta]